MQRSTTWACCLCFILFSIETGHSQESRNNANAPYPRSSEPIATIIVQAGKHERKNCVVTTRLNLKQTAELDAVTLVDSDENRIPGQICRQDAFSDRSEAMPMLTFVIPEIPAEKTRQYNVFQSQLKPSQTFKWHNDGSTQSELQFGDQAVIRYMFESLDDATPQRRQQTYKTYHHVFSPNGKVLLTKGPGGLYPHHRGIFYGFNRISYEGNSADTWHCRNGACQRQSSDPVNIAGQVFGRDINKISWHGKDGLLFADEIRQLTAYKVDGNTLLEFESRLHSSGADIKLDGDPQHAGVQFRASQRVADETKDQTYYVRPDGIGRPGGFRNWSAKPNEKDANKNHINLPFHAMCFTIGEQQYTCCSIDHPDNPKPARFSERNYGRFGSYFSYELSKQKPLKVKYRFWIQDGPMTVDECQKLANDFAQPVTVTTKVSDAR